MRPVGEEDCFNSLWLGNYWEFGKRKPFRRRDRVSTSRFVLRDQCEPFSTISPFWQGDINFLLR